ncbi:hypothetical protein JMJ35_006731 [Cladonia borealis]|uniref:Heme haloperoxidase family profile domain-containing protein n=1 Tax=Cladonia borealis TaxID=184061 RepID=A0AA39QZM8_9LECA|nr:hypothetical protein JMJ35_006731 [Cladonia borealis]
MDSDLGIHEATPLLQKGVYHPPSKTDLRGPCPLVNALANHGYIPRDGRGIRAKELYTALDVTGLSRMLRWGFAYGSLVEHFDDPPTGFWAFIRNPLAYLLRKFGMRPRAQKDSSGIPYLNLDQLALPGAVEHDVSLTLRDIGQGDNMTCQEDLVSGLISISSNGRKITTEDFAVRRRQRLEQQERENPSLTFDSLAHQLGCTEIALVQKLFGVKSRGYSVPVPYVKAIFEEERLPAKEGWTKRSWWHLGLMELYAQIEKLKRCVGPVKYTTPPK